MLIGLVLRFWKPIAVLAVLAVVFGAGWHYGAASEEAQQAAERARIERRLATVADDASEAEAARLAAERDRDILAEELENAARADPDANRPALGIDSVRRLDRR